MATITKPRKLYRLIFWISDKFGYDCMIANYPPQYEFSIIWRRKQL